MGIGGTTADERFFGIAKCLRVCIGTFEVILFRIVLASGGNPSGAKSLTEGIMAEPGSSHNRRKVAVQRK